MVTWQRALELMQWRSPFGDLPGAWKARRFRRACWPKKTLYWDRSDEGGRDRAIEPPRELTWHIWHADDVGDQSTFEGGLVQGWGGQLGANNAEVVSVNGIEQTDGTMYTPTYDDLRATDWESLAG